MKKNAVVKVPAGSQVFGMAFANAMYQQRVHMNVENSKNTIDFEGAGERNTLVGKTLFSVPRSLDDIVNLQVQIEHLPTGSSSWLPSDTFHRPDLSNFSGGVNQAIILSEDSTDNDNNDLTVLLGWWKTPDPRNVVTGPVATRLPGNRNAVIGIFTNAEAEQKVSITLLGIAGRDGPNMTLNFQGSGEKNNVMAWKTIFIPAAADGGERIEARVEIRNRLSGAGENGWRYSNTLIANTVTYKSYSSVFVVSEDGADKDYNDTIVMIGTWAAKP